MESGRTLRGREALEAALKTGRGRASFSPRTKRGARYDVAPAGERTVDGILFASKAEAARFLELKALRRSGHVSFFLRQVPFHLPGGARYLLDFLVFWADGRQSFEDVKGHRTEVYELKRRQVAELYGVEIEEIRAR
jgi:hypothetical protein